MPLNLTEQPALFGDDPLRAAVADLAEADQTDRGAIYTRREVADFMLDLAGYNTDFADLTGRRLLETFCGTGDLLLPAIDRLLACARRTERLTVAHLVDALRAVELHTATYEQIRNEIDGKLADVGLDRTDRGCLLNAWLCHDDFLLWRAPHSFDVIIVNPPYVRSETAHVTAARERLV